ncbi:MAG: hypothetical protein V1740_07330 [Candidatus Woesearchaeota archaeon]
MNKQLADWIKSEEAQGYSENQLRDSLLKQGYNIKDVNDAINSFGTKKVSSKFSAREIFKPTILKCFLPALVLILILVSFFINSAHIPPIGVFFCDTFGNQEKLSNLSDTVREKALENNANPQELINLYQQQEVNIRELVISSRDVFSVHAKLLITGNLYLTYSMIYNLNPFFPAPCEAGFVLGKDFANPNYCRYYLSKETYNCINAYMIKQKQQSDAGGIPVMFGGNLPLPPYNKISFLSLIINSIILIGLIYAIISLVSFANKKLSEQNSKVKVIITGLLIILPILIYLISNFVYLLFLIPLVVVFAVSPFIKDEKHNKMFLYIMAILLIVLLVCGLLIVNLLIVKATAPALQPSIIENEVEYKIIQCQNKTVLSLEEKKMMRMQDPYLNEEWNVCYNPSCFDICKDYCGQKRIGSATRLRGDNPSCICGC